MQGYSELYSMYAKAHSRSDEELKNFFKGQMTAGEQVISKTVSTFKTLCKFAEFDEVASVLDVRDATLEQATNAESTSARSAVEKYEQTMPVCIEVHVQVDGGSSVEQINAIFKGLSTLLETRNGEAT